LREPEKSELVKAVGLIIERMTAEERNVVFEDLKLTLQGNVVDSSRLLKEVD